MGTTLTTEYVTARLQEVENERRDLLAEMRVLERAAMEADPDAHAATGPVYAGVEIDFTGAANHRERVVRIAEAVDGPLVINDMAQCLVERGQSNAKGLCCMNIGST